MVDLYDKPQAIEPAGEDICVVGGGASGSLFAIYFNRRVQEIGGFDRPVRLHWIDPNGVNNGGVAYGQCHPEDLLNETAIKMSPWDVGAYSSFVKDRYGFDDACGFYSRQSYQAFLAEEAYRAVRELAENGVEVVEYCALVSGITQQGSNCVSLQLDSDQNLSFDEALSVVATGYGANNRFADLRGHEGYLHSLYDLDDFAVFHDRLRSELKPQRIALIGSGPAVFDFVNRVQSDCSQHSLDIISSSGALPKIRDISIEGRDYGSAEFCNRERFLSVSSYDDWAVLVKKEFERAALKDIPERQAAIWVLQATTESVQDYSVFSSDLYKEVLHRATPVVDRSYINLDRFDYQVSKGRVCSDDIKVQADGGFLIAGQGRYDAVVNCTGFERQSALVDQLCESGLARYCSDRFKVVDSAVNLIGPMTHNGCDGIESFAPQAEQVAERVCERLNGSVFYSARFIA